MFGDACGSDSEEQTALCGSYDITKSSSLCGDLYRGDQDRALSLERAGCDDAWKGERNGFNRSSVERG